MNDSYTSILPGARVRTQEGFIGTVERLDSHAADGQPDHMVVRSDDAHWRYSIPLMLVSMVSQETFHPAVQVDLSPDDLAHYIVEDLQQSNGAIAPAVRGGEWSPSATEDTLRIPLAAEELYARKQPIVLGRVHIHKGVELVEQSLTVPIYHEEAVVEHIPIDQYDANAPTTRNEMIIPVMEEQLVVEKRQVVKEYIRVRKTLVTQEQNVHDMVRREYVEVSEQRQNGTSSTPLVNADSDPTAAGSA